MSPFQLRRGIRLGRYDNDGFHLAVCVSSLMLDAFLEKEWDSPRKKSRKN